MTECSQSRFEFQAHYVRRVFAEFDSGAITSDGGALLVRGGSAAEPSGTAGRVLSGRAWRATGLQSFKVISPASNSDQANVKIGIADSILMCDIAAFANSRALRRQSFCILEVTCTSSQRRRISASCCCAVAEPVLTCVIFASISAS
jgi:hypothetical protein